MLSNACVGGYGDILMFCACHCIVYGQLYMLQCKEILTNLNLHIP